MRVLLDTNVVLDYLLDREPFAEAAAGVWEAHRQGRIEAFISAITPINIFYIARKLKGVDSALAVTRALIAEFKIITLSEDILKHAINIHIKDYEDAVQISSAILSNLDAVVTRNLKDYSASQLPAYAPDYLWKSCRERAARTADSGANKPVCWHGEASSGCVG